MRAIWLSLCLAVAFAAPAMAEPQARAETAAMLSGTAWAIQGPDGEAARMVFDGGGKLRMESRGPDKAVKSQEGIWAIWGAAADGPFVLMISIIEPDKKIGFRYLDAQYDDARPVAMAFTWTSESELGGVVIGEPEKNRPFTMKKVAP